MNNIHHESTDPVGLTLMGIHQFTMILDFLLGHFQVLLEMGQHILDEFLLMTVRTFLGAKDTILFIMMVHVPDGNARLTSSTGLSVMDLTKMMVALSGTHAEMTDGAKDHSHAQLFVRLLVLGDVHHIAVRACCMPFRTFGLNMAMKFELCASKRAFRVVDAGDIGSFVLGHHTVVQVVGFLLIESCWVGKRWTEGAFDAVRSF